MDTRDRKSVRLFSMFQNQSKAGKTFFRGQLGDTDIVLLKSDRTTKDGTPIWDAIVQPREFKKRDQVEDRPHAGDRDDSLQDEIPF